MNKHFQTFLRGFWWKLGATLALLLVGYMLPARAEAQTCTIETDNCSQDAAHRACDARQAGAGNWAFKYPRCEHKPGPGTGGRYQCQLRRPDSSVWVGCANDGKGAHDFFYSNATCPSGKTWNAASGYCEQQCSSKPDIQGLLAVESDSNGQICRGGCSYAPLPEGSGAFGGEARWGATWRATGTTCSVDNHVKPYDSNKDICTNQGSLTQCVKPDGKFCATASTGKRICWNPGETGQKQTLDGSLAGDRQKAPAAPSVTGIDGGTTSNGTTTINNTTYNQEFKDGGSSSGARQSNTGDGGVDDTDGDGKNEDQGSASGGGTCGAPPSCSGDPVNCAILQQQWQTRCKDDKNDDGQPDWTEGDKPTGEGEGSDGDVGEGAYKRFGLSLGTDRLDTDNIFGGGTCPTFSIEVMGFSASTADIPAWCDIAAIMRAVVLIMGAYVALQILLGRI